MLEIVHFDPQAHSALLTPLTRLLHAAYAPLAAAGMRYHASHQDEVVTRDRLLDGEGYLAFRARELVGTCALREFDPKSECEYYRQPGVYTFGQFAIKPELQGTGLGSRILEYVERRARALGARELALDTSEHASHLITMYEKRGYKIVSKTQWEITNYRSVIMSKVL